MTRAYEGQYERHEGTDDNDDGSNDENEQDDEGVVWGFQDPTPWLETLLAQDEQQSWGRQYEQNDVPAFYFQLYFDLDMMWYCFNENLNWFDPIFYWTFCVKLAIL